MEAIKFSGSGAIIEGSWDCDPNCPNWNPRYAPDQYVGIKNFGGLRVLRFRYGWEADDTAFNYYYTGCCLRSSQYWDPAILDIPISPWDDGNYHSLSWEFINSGPKVPSDGWGGPMYRINIFIDGALVKTDFLRPYYRADNYGGGDIGIAFLTANGIKSALGTEIYDPTLIQDGSYIHYVHGKTLDDLCVLRHPSSSSSSSHSSSSSSHSSSSSSSHSSSSSSSSTLCKGQGCPPGTRVDSCVGGNVPTCVPCTNGNIEESQVLAYVASSTLDNGEGRFGNSSVHGDYGWVARNNSVPGEEFIELQLDGVHDVSGFYVWGLSFGTFATTTLKIMYRETISPWKYASGGGGVVGEGGSIFNINPDHVVCAQANLLFNETVRASALRLYPLSWPQNDLNIDAPGIRATPQVCT